MDVEKENQIEKISGYLTNSIDNTNDSVHKIVTSANDLNKMMKDIEKRASEAEEKY